MNTDEGVSGRRSTFFTEISKFFQMKALEKTAQQAFEGDRGDLEQFMALFREEARQVREKLDRFSLLNI